MNEAGLSGFVVLVTRPEHQADELVTAIDDAGGEAIRFPVIDIEPQDSADVSRRLEALPAADITIFISTNAVMYGLHCVAGDETAIAVIGPATKSAIESAGRQVDIFPEQGYDSEHLLAAAELQDVSGKNIRIIRGDGGRELLADTLRERGATVDYLSVYRRLTRAYSPNLLAGLEHRLRYCRPVAANCSGKRRWLRPALVYYKRLQIKSPMRRFRWPTAHKQMTWSGR
jgi:uroporphyrinogen-III synthase